MDNSTNRKRNMDINGNHGYQNNSHLVPTYVDPQKKAKKVECVEDNDTETVTVDMTPSCCGVKWGNRYNPAVFNCIAYFGAAACFLIMTNISHLPDLLFPTLGNLLPLDIHDQNVQRVLVVVVLWGFHFLRRFGEVLFVHEYKRGMALIEAVGAIVYYCFFGVWIGWSVNFRLGYRTPPDMFFIPGILICFGGGIGNFICHLYLREMSLKRNRRSLSYYTSESHHVVPDRCCFKLLACPHYLFEIITWIGFSLVTFTLSAWTFTLATCITLVIYSRKRHIAYRKEFDGKNGRDLYPRHRKALIPYVF